MDTISLTGNFKRFSHLKDFKGYKNTVLSKENIRDIKDSDLSDSELSSKYNVDISTIEIIRNKC